MSLCAGCKNDAVCTDAHRECVGERKLCRFDFAVGDQVTVEGGDTVWTVVGLFASRWAPAGTYDWIHLQCGDRQHSTFPSRLRKVQEENHHAR